jgi:hypothetical protein
LRSIGSFFDRKEVQGIVPKMFILQHNPTRASPNPFSILLEEMALFQEMITFYNDFPVWAAPTDKVPCVQA